MLVYALRRLGSAVITVLLMSVLIFVLVRGVADTEPFDLSLPLWAIVIFSLLIQNELAAKTSQPMATVAHAAADHLPFNGVFGSANVIPL